jgi:hypothetical protein
MINAEKREANPMNELKPYQQWVVRIENRMLGRMGELQRAYGYEAYCIALQILISISRS